MNFFASECSSGCESGWTNYLEQSFLSANPSKKANRFNRKSSSFIDEHRENRGKQEIVDDDDDVEEEEEEEDLSMVSDASSGPPHFYEDYIDHDNNQYNYSVPKVATLNKNGAKRHRNKEHQRLQENNQELPSFLDDTASSPFNNFSKNNYVHTNNQASMESAFHYPQGFSATYYQGGPAFQDHFGFLQPSQSGNQLQNNNWF